MLHFALFYFQLFLAYALSSHSFGSPPRTVSQNDIFAESIGATIGGLLWCYIGQTVTDWIYSYTRQESRKKKIDWWLEIYMIGLVLYHFIPLDLTISSGELAHKFSQGKIRIIPFSGVELNLSTFYNWSKEIVIFIPVGIFFSIWRMNQKIKVRPMEICLACGVAFTVFIEFGQVFIYSRFADTADIILTSTGIALGVVFMHKVYGVKSKGRIEEKKDYHLRTWPWLIFSFFYSVFLVVVFCIPFDPINDMSMIKSRYIGFYKVPFSALYHGSEFNAVSEILKKGLFFAPLGGLLAMLVSSLSLPDRVKNMFLVGMCWNL